MYFPKFITTRLEVELQELKIRDIIALCEIPAHLNEAAIGATLACIVKSSNLPIAQFTLQERYAVICAYVTAKEQGDWMASDNGKYSQFVGEIDAPPDDYVFEFGGDTLRVVPLTSEYIEAMERVILSGAVGDNPSSMLWFIAAAASQIRGVDDDVGNAEELVKARCLQLQSLNEEDFFALMDHFSRGLLHINHLFNTWYADDGVIVLPQEVGAVNPARFRFDTCISQGAIEAFAKR